MPVGSWARAWKKCLWNAHLNIGVFLLFFLQCLILNNICSHSVGKQTWGVLLSYRNSKASTLIMNPCLKMEKIQLMHSKKDQIHRFLFIKAMKLILLCNLYDNQMDKTLVTIVCLSTLWKIPYALHKKSRRRMLCIQLSVFTVLFLSKGLASFLLFSTITGLLRTEYSGIEVLFCF